MATIRTYLIPDASSLVNFKSWAQAISNALSTFGWVQTADSGQVNWSSIAAVPTAGVYVYEIWKSGDFLSSTNPIYLKVEYGTPGSNHPGLAITVGTGSTGTGVLNNAGARNLLNNNSSLTPFECFFSGSSSRFAFFLWRNFNKIFFSVERSHNISGAETADYVTYLTSAVSLGPANCYQQTVMPPNNGGPLFYEPFGLTFHTNSTSSLTVGNTIVAVPFWPMVGKIDTPLMGSLLLKTADIADGMVFPFSMYGASHQYVALVPAPQKWANMANASIAMRFE